FACIADAVVVGVAEDAAGDRAVLGGAKGCRAVDAAGEDGDVTSGGGVSGIPVRGDDLAQRVIARRETEGVMTCRIGDGRDFAGVETAAGVVVGIDGSPGDAGFAAVADAVAVAVVEDGAAEVDGVDGRIHRRQRGGIVGVGEVDAAIVAATGAAGASARGGGRAIRAGAAVRAAGAAVGARAAGARAGGARAGG